jgi:hypothetical protein
MDSPIMRSLVKVRASFSALSGASSWFLNPLKLKLS